MRSEELKKSIAFLTLLSTLLTGCSSTNNKDNNVKPILDGTEMVKSIDYSEDYVNDLIRRLEESGKITKDGGYIPEPKKEYTYKQVDLNDPRLDQFLKENNMFKMSDYRLEMQKIIESLIVPEYHYSTYHLIRQSYHDYYSKMNPMGFYSSSYFIGYTTDPNHEGIGLVKKIRIPHYSFYAYKIFERSDGKFVILHSEYYDSIDEIPSEYQFVDKEFYRKDDYYIYLSGIDADEYLNYYNNGDLNNPKIKKLINSDYRLHK